MSALATAEPTAEAVTLAPNERIEDAKLPIARLVVDSRYQRIISGERVNRIADEYDPARLLPLVVSARDDGSLVIVDGQHRYRALIQMGPPDRLVDCRVIHGMTFQREAFVFAALNDTRNRRGTTPGVVFKALLEAGDEERWRIYDTVTDLDLDLDFLMITHDWRNIKAVGTVWKIGHRQGTEHLRDVLRVARAAWPGDRQAFSIQILEGLDALLLRARPHGLNILDLIEKLQKATPANLIARAAAAKGIVDVRQGQGIGRAMLEHYNSGKRGNRLPAWEDMPAPKKSELTVARIAEGARRARAAGR
jgi:hypothetical protein